MQACPYDALYIDPNTQTAAKCNYCAHRIDVGLEPACVNVCPTQAIISGDLDDPNSQISKLKIEQSAIARKVEKGTRPALFYIDADADSLEPLASPVSENFMWSQQSSGVGHFAQDSDSHPEHVLEKLGRLLSFGEKSTGLDGSSSSNRVKDVIKAIAAEPRRAYDAPQKGVLWGWQVSGYLWTKSISAGVIIAVMLAKLISASFVDRSLELFANLIALVFLGLTGGLLVWDLDKPARFLSVLLRPQWRSWLVRGAYIITAYSALLLLNLAIAIFDFDSRLHWWLPVPLITLALLTAVYTAFLFAQAKGRDFWQSRTVPLNMVTHAIICGAAFLALFTRFWTVDFNSYLRYLLVITATLHLVMTMIELYLPHQSKETQRVVASILVGNYSRLFWGLAMLSGTLVPIGLLAIVPPQWMFVAAALLLIGVFASQHIWVRAPQQIPLS